MRIRIDLKILIFLLLFYLTNQLQIYLTVMFFCVIHELGHIIMGIILQMKPEKVEIMPCGLSVCFKVNENAKNIKLKNVIVACAGPLLSLILVVLYICFDSNYIARENAIYSNILILVFNLLPLYPLDGGRIIKGILHIIIGEEEKVNLLINKISNITMILITLVSSITVFYFKNIAIFLACLFLWFITIQENNAKALDILHEK